MGGIEGVRYVPLNLAGGGTPPDALTRLLLTGSVLRGRIVLDGALLSLVAGNQKLPLPKGVALSPGTLVEARITHEGGTPHLRLQVLDGQQSQSAGPRAQVAVPSQTSAPSVHVPPQLAALITPEKAAALLPKAALIPPKAMEALLTVLAARPEVGRALARLLPLMDGQPAEESVPAERTANLRAAIQAMDAETPEEFRRAIEIARELIGARADRPMTRASGDSPSSRSLLENLVTLRDALAARAATTDGREAVRTIDAALERFGATTLQNVRSFEMPYQFFAIPFLPSTGIEHAIVHLVGRDGRGPGGGRETHSVVVDLQLTNLGALWIAIQSTGTACSCVIHAESDMARDAIDVGAPVLEEGLRRAGFAAAQVRTEPWDGDRVTAAAALFSQTGSFEAEV